MSKHLIHSTAIGVALTLIAAVSAFAKPEVVRVGNLFLRDNGGISPTKLPKHRQAPISANLNGQIGTVDGSPPPAVRSVIADFDRTIRVNAKGLPICRESQLTARSTAAAKKACQNSIVGSGEGEVEVAFPVLLIHTYVAVPAPTAVIATVKLTRIHRGHYGIHAVAQIPRIAGGAGSVTRFKLTINREFTYRGKKESYLTASCPTGHYYAEGKILFADGTSLKITHVLPCTPKG